MHVYRSVVLDALRELADTDLQNRVWSGQGGDEMSSFTESEEALFDDGGPLAALGRGDVFGPAVDDKLRLLGKKLDAIDEARAVEELSADATLDSCRLCMCPEVTGWRSIRAQQEQQADAREDGMAELAYCRVCGYELPAQPWGDRGSAPSFELCPCCGVEFGYEDATPDAVRHFRDKWFAAGSPWIDRRTPSDGLGVTFRLDRVRETLR